ncbi:hypothetical protein [Actinomadura sp. 9N215]|uniref:hypothetical protein n=1 Tax=Actinomadura sp. 9N215 TaxID=3375150 RepID=UPI0037BDB96C
MAYIESTEPEQDDTDSATWHIWARLILGLFVISTGVGASVCIFPGPFGLLTGWAVATGAGIDLSLQTLDQTER